MIKNICKLFRKPGNDQKWLMNTQEIKVVLSIYILNIGLSYLLKHYLPFISFYHNTSDEI